MIYKEIPLLENSNEGTSLTLYIQSPHEGFTIQKRPLILICPGGGYSHVSEREAEPEALEFLSMGCHAAILRYSVRTARYPQQLTELAYAMKYIRDHAKEWQIDEEKIYVEGSSAGAHLAASLGIFYKEKWLAEKVGAASSEELRPNGMILCYPVITSGEYANRPSFDYLVGDDPELLELVSLEKHVTKDTPKTFIWHTMDDAVVPIENSLLFISALRKQGIPAEFHMYPSGNHGLALCNPLSQSEGAEKEIQRNCENWISLVENWIFEGAWRKLS